MYENYTSPLNNRYASAEMLELFSPKRKFSTWRSLWIALAETEKDLGLPITQEQIDELKKYRSDINFSVAEEREAVVRHDVMAHVYAYGQQCPEAKGIIHLGATSCYVTDNTDLILMREGLDLVAHRLLKVMEALAAFAERYKAMPTLGFTHFQPAQLVTVGKRAALWLQDLYIDYEALQDVREKIRFLGSRGTTGTQASFMRLFDGDEDKCRELDKRIAKAMGFDKIYPVSGQTYTRKIDSQVLHVLAGIAQSATKFSNDLRLLQHMKEIEEPFEKGQIGSSAMAYKRNPMRSERIASLARYVIVNALNPDFTAATQWFERTLDDSANKRISVPESFLAIDAVLLLYLNIVSGLVVHPRVIAARIDAELPFMCTENILMAAVRRGGDRQELHEKIRRYSMEAARQVKDEGKPNPLLYLIARDKAFDLVEDDLNELLDAKLYIGRAPGQVEDFLRDYIYPLLEENKDILAEAETYEIHV